jgi:hypothetical protein
MRSLSKARRATASISIIACSATLRSLVPFTTITGCPLGAGGDVDRVEADAVAGDDLQPRRHGEGRAVHPLQPAEHGIGGGEVLVELLDRRVLQGDDVEVARSASTAWPAGVKGAAKQDAVRHVDGPPPDCGGMVKPSAPGAKAPCRWGGARLGFAGMTVRAPLSGLTSGSAAGRARPLLGLLLRLTRPWA